MKRLAILALALILPALPSCAALDSAKWSVGTTYDPSTKQYSFSVGKEPIGSK